MFEMDTTTEDAALPTHCRQMPQLGRDGPWSRVFIADSWFGSVEAAVALGKRKMHFIGAVKTAHGGFPKQYIEACSSPCRLAYASYSSLKSMESSCRP